MPLTLWHSLYLTCDTANEQIARALTDTLSDAGYTPYDPFGLIPGKAYPDTVKLFIAPPTDGWRRVFSDGELPAWIADVLATFGDTLAVRLTVDAATISAPIDPFTRALRAGVTPAALEAALQWDVSGTPTSAPTVGGVTLPPEIEALAKGVDPAAAQKMFQRISTDLFAKAGGDAAQAAQFASQTAAVDWSTPAALRLIRAVGMTTLPANWRTPDFATLRDAYALHARRKRKPSAALYGGDQATMNAVPNALDYIPVYAGR